jgi:PEGA domain
MIDPPRRAPPSASSAPAILALSLALLLSWLTGSATAGAGLVTVVGNGKTPDLKLFTLVAEAAAKEAGWTLASGALDPRATREATVCMDRDRPLPCLASLISPRGADRMLFLEVGAAKDDASVLQITATVVLGGSGAPAVAERFCKTCDDSQLRATVNDLVRSLIQHAAVTAGSTVVAMQARPAGAWIYLDGNMLPASSAGADTRARVPTYPGPHTVTIEKAGFETQILKVVAVEGQTTEVNAELRSSTPVGSGPEEPEEPMARPDPWRARLGWGLVAIGGLTAISGGVLIAVDEDQPPLGEDRAEEYFDSATFGVATLAIGAALAVAGGSYLYLTRPRSSKGLAPKPATSTAALPTVIMLPGGGIVGLTRGF